MTLDKSIAEFKAAADHDTSGTGRAEQVLIKKLEHLRRAAKEGRTDAQYYLFLCYAMGLAVPKDPIEATLWCLRAAAGGNEQARKELFSFAPCLLSFVERGKNNYWKALSLLMFVKRLDKRDMRKRLKELDHLKDPKEVSG